MRSLRSRTFTITIIRDVARHIAIHRVGSCIVATLNHFARWPEDAVHVDHAVHVDFDRPVAIVIAAGATGLERHRRSVSPSALRWRTTASAMSPSASICSRESRSRRWRRTEAT